VFDLVTNWQLWVILGFLLLIVEMFTPGFVLACFAVACIPPAVMTYFRVFDIRTQLMVFGVSTLLVFFFLRPAVLRFLTNRKETRESNADALMGRKGTVVKTISSDGTSGGYVKVEGKTWWSFSPEKLEIPEGTRVVVSKVRGASLEVRPEEENDAGIPSGMTER